VISLDNCTDVGFDFAGSSGVITPVEPTLGFKVVGSTGAYKVLLLGFLTFLLNAPVLQSSLASDRPVLLLCVLFWVV